MRSLGDVSSLTESQVVEAIENYHRIAFTFKEALLVVYTEDPDLLWNLLGSLLQ